MIFHINTFSWFFLIINNFTIYCVFFLLQFKSKNLSKHLFDFFFVRHFHLFRFFFSIFFIFFIFFIFIICFVSIITSFLFFRSTFSTFFFSRLVHHFFTILFCRFFVQSSIVVVSLTFRSFFFCSTFNISFQWRQNNQKKMMFIVCYISHVSNDFKLSI